MGFVWTTAAKDLRRFRRDPAAFLLWLGIPILIGLLMTVAFGGSDGPRPKARVLVADEDDNVLSGFLVGALGQAGGLVETEAVDREAGRVRMEKGDATALLVIPKGFSSAVLEETPLELTLVTNPSQSVLPGIVEEVVSVFVDAVFYLHRLIGEDLKALAQGPPDGGDTFADETIASFSVKVNQLVEGISDYLNPLAIELETTSGESEPKKGETNAAMLFVPSLLFMALLFMAQGLSADLWQERERHTLRRVAVSPRGVLAFLSGKVLAGASVILAITTITFGLAYPYFGWSWKLYPVAVAWATFTGAFLLLGMMLIQLVASSQRAGSVLSMTIVFPLIMLGGSFFPFEAMPDWMVSIGKLTPNGWALIQLKAILSGEIEAGSLALAFLGLGALGTFFFLLGGRRLRSSFARA